MHDAARLLELEPTVGLAAFLPLEVAADNEGLFDHKVEVLEIDDRVEGFVAFAPDEISWLYVNPAMHGRGYGKALLDHALSQCGPVVRTEVLEGNEPATRLYFASGFELERRVTGKLTGNESFAATGLYLRRERPD